jgi:hypothetical protein
MMRGSNPGRAKRFITPSPRCPDPHSLIFNGYRGSFPGQKGWGTKLTAHLLLVLWLRMSGAIPLIPIYAYITYDIFVKLQLGCHPVAAVQYTFTHKRYTEQHKTYNTQNNTKHTIHRTTQNIQYIEQHKN